MIAKNDKGIVKTITKMVLIIGTNYNYIEPVNLTIIQMLSHCVNVIDVLYMCHQYISNIGGTFLYVFPDGLWGAHMPKVFDALLSLINHPLCVF